MENLTVNGTDTMVWTPEMTEKPFEVYRHYYERQIVAALCITTSIIGIIGNTFVITAVPLSKKLRTVTNVFVVNLSMSDLLSCIFLPWEAVAVLSEDGWPLPQAYWLCLATSVITIISSGCSVNNLALIAVNRWIGITKSSTLARRVYTRQKIALMLAFSWALPLCLILIPPSTGFGELGYEPQYGVCSWVKANPYSFIQNVILGIFYFPIQFIVIALCYTSIFRYVIKTSRRMVRHDTKSISGAISGSSRSMRKKLWKRQIAVTKNLVYIVLAFVICLAPFYFSVIPLGYDWSIRMTPYAGAIVFFNNCVNPIIYATSHPDFKEAFGYMVRCKCKDIPQSRAQTMKNKCVSSTIKTDASLRSTNL